MSSSKTTDFERFVADAEPNLRRALIGLLGVDNTADAVAHALAWAWENWDRVQELSNPTGYLYRVARTSAHKRVAKTTRWLIQHDARLPDYEPGLGAALEKLTVHQRTAVWLVHGCGWTYAEAAEALDITASTLGNHLTRGLRKLRRELGEQY